MLRFYRRTPIRRIAILLAPFLLAGCALPPAVTWASLSADGISYIATGKSTTDHAVSAIAHEDCALHRGLKDEAICNPDGDVLISSVGAEPSGAQSSLLPRDGQSSYPPLSSQVSQPGPYATHGVHLGSYENATVANYGWTQIWSQHWKVLQGVQASIEYGTVGSGGAPGYNLYGKGLTKDQAHGLCRNLLARQASCTVVNF